MTTTTKRKTKNAAGPKDANVGDRLRARRILLGMSQKDLGSKVNLTFQQIQKYERGANRIGAGQLHDFAQILQVDIGYFFEGLDTGRAIDAAPLPERATLALARDIEDIADPEVRTALTNLVRKATSLPAAA